MFQGLRPLQRVQVWSLVGELGFYMPHHMAQKLKKKKKLQVFPGGSRVKNQPANAGDMGSIPGLRRWHRPRSHEAHVPQLLSPCSRAWEPQLLKPECPRACAQQEKPPQWEARAQQLESSPHWPQLEETRAWQRRPCTVKTKYINT